MGFEEIDGGIHAVVDALYVDAEEAVEIVFGGGFELADVRDAGVVDEDVKRADLGEVTEYFVGLGLVGNVAGVGGGVSACDDDFLDGGDGGFFVNIDSTNGGTRSGEAQGDGATDATARAGDAGNFAIESEGARFGW